MIQPAVSWFKEKPEAVRKDTKFESYPRASTTGSLSTFANWKNDPTQSCLQLEWVSIIGSLLVESILIINPNVVQYGGVHLRQYHGQTED